MDVEEISRRHLAAGTPDDDIVRLLSRDILTIKRDRIPPAYAEEFARAVLTEAKNSTGLTGDLFTFEPAGSSMGEFGVGSRGAGDFFAHRQLARIIGRTSATVGVDEMDDAGAVCAGGDYIITTVDGMHSRLSDFPFLAGFHVTRATLRDVYVMGAKPVALLSDIHVADDGDVAKIFDYTAGVTAVGEAMGVPLVTGSTLRIGGDMVLGSRMTGCVGAVGVARHLTARKAIQPGDVLLMTEGAGGGTIATAAIYSGFPEVVDETINLHFLKACEALLASSVLPGIHAMTDVTNGGLRGDAYEMAETANCRIVVEEDELRTLVQPKVLAMLDALEIDYLGVSLDALLVVAPPEVAPEIKQVVGSAGVAMKEIGYVEEGAAESVLVVDGKIRDFSPRFRESAYTPVKKVVDGDKRDFEEMKAGVERAAEAAIAKKERMLARLRSS
ncbi:MAG: AIR synthase-related protein [Methanoculleus bourgensis]|jgi:hydrogenase expression/formation protein|uniref:AIR synthase-related protein n=1 Tax=Methanoculleus bourgensis TaxID=83986 RepID=UPI0007BC93FD|nr:AIR synthase-related protein [Methanoculleus bourgensis]SAI88100.1 Hydrogenase maturation factor [Methanoculleus bourgensis]